MTDDVWKRRLVVVCIIVLCWRIAEMIWKNWTSSLVVLAVLLVASRGPCVEVIPSDSPAPRDSFVQVKTTGGFVWVMGIAGGQFIPVKTHQCDDGLLFVGPPGQYVIYGVEDVAGQQTQFQRFIEIGKGVEPEPVPPPDPPDPVPPAPPVPPPDPPEPMPPPDIERAYDIAPAVYRESLRVNTSVADLEKLATQYATAAKYLHEMRLTPSGAQRQLREVRQSLSGDWTAWESATELAVLAAIEKYGSGQLLWRDYCREIAGALRAAADTRKKAAGWIESRR